MTLRTLPRFAVRAVLAACVAVLLAASPIGAIPSRSSIAAAGTAAASESAGPRRPSAISGIAGSSIRRKRQPPFTPETVVPAKAGTHNPGTLDRSRRMGPRLRGDDS